MEKEEEKLCVDLENDLKESKRKSNVSLPELGLSYETLLSEGIGKLLYIKGFKHTSKNHPVLHPYSLRLLPSVSGSSNTNGSPDSFTFNASCKLCAGSVETISTL